MDYAFDLDLFDTEEDELSDIKLWLFQENIRIQGEKQDLEDKRRSFEREQKTVKQQINAEMKRLDARKKQCALEEKLIEEKWKALKRGFDELDEDRRALKRQEQKLLDEQKRLECKSVQNAGNVTLFFRGVRDSGSLKKRYRDLLKIFHPDNMAGDKETVQSITQEYDVLKDRLL